ncbi:MAG: nicotinamidase [Hyphomicrobiales bacterium]|nr:nicotinamidase [Hyphomicrobiales bacterium]
MSGLVATTDADVLIIVDVQNDFVSGSLAIPGARDIVPVINRLVVGFEHVIVTQDWHPPGHVSFASTHPGTRHLETVETAYGPQTVFRDHCVQGTPGADLDPGLDVTKSELILRKGYRRDVDSYSAFFENDRKTSTGLGAYLHARGFRRVFCCGLALYGCVKATAEGARREQLETFIIEDASKGRETTDGANERAVQELNRLGVITVDSRHFRL